MSHNRYSNNPRRDAKPEKPGRPLAQKLIGEVVTEKVMNSNENKESVGKARPAILLREVNGQFDTMGLTTSVEYASGIKRTPISDYKSLGLVAPGHYWGDKPTRVSRADIGDHIGWVSHAAINDMRQLGIALPDDAWRVLEACANKHGPKPADARAADGSAEPTAPKT